MKKRIANKYTITLVTLGLFILVGVIVLKNISSENSESGNISKANQTSTKIVSSKKSNNVASKIIKNKSTSSGETVSSSVSVPNSAVTTPIAKTGPEDLVASLVAVPALLIASYCYVDSRNFAKRDLR